MDDNIVILILLLSLIISIKYLSNDFIGEDKKDCIYMFQELKKINSILNLNTLSDRDGLKFTIKFLSKIGFKFINSTEKVIKIKNPNMLKLIMEHILMKLYENKCSIQFCDFLVDTVKYLQFPDEFTGNKLEKKLILFVINFTINKYIEKKRFDYSSENTRFDESDKIKYTEYIHEYLEKTACLPNK